MAAGALRAIEEAGFKVPDDVAVMGFDGLERHARAFPTLSTVAQPIADLGKSAVRTLLHRIAHPDEPIFHHYLETRMVLRGSCGCASESTVPLADLGVAAASSAG